MSDRKTVRQEFEFKQGENLSKFLAELATKGWVINNEETYFLDGTTTIYVGYK